MYWIVFFLCCLFPFESIQEEWWNKTHGKISHSTVLDVRFTKGLVPSSYQFLPVVFNDIALSVVNIVVSEKVFWVVNSLSSDACVDVCCVDACWVVYSLLSVDVGDDSFGVDWLVVVYFASVVVAYCFVVGIVDCASSKPVLDILYKHISFFFFGGGGGGGQVLHI